MENTEIKPDKMYTHIERMDGTVYCEKKDKAAIPISAGGGSGYGRGAVKCMFCGRPL